ncbi:apolipoprotein N-acyltransferase [Granulicoccus sp. GXG6511]|uniref:apolipoprotein N-acyltransferase n=1 Tax=Granulicoccus sp. GXG6511 TaxID=3381351 RepID=UPI003D7D87C7
MAICLPTSPCAGPTTQHLVPAWPRGLRFVVATAMGAVAGLAFAPTNLWPLLFVGMAGWLMLFDPKLRPAGRGFGLGYGFGLGLGAVSLNWLSALVDGAGAFLAAALIAFEALFFGLLGMAVRWLRGLTWWPLAVGLAWGAIEFIYARVPFGGFGWIRLAYAQADAPLGGVLPIVGVMGVTVATALLAALLAWLVVRLWANPRGWVCPTTITLGVLIGIAGIISVGAAYQPAGDQGSVTIGMVQGNVDGGAGIGAMGRARSVTNNHLGETITLMARARAGAVPMPDFVLWPENSTDIDPQTDAQTRATVASAVAVAERPILVGAVTDGPGANERQTTALWWDPERGITDKYHKRNLVPFGEYIPFRDILLPRIPLLELVGAQSVPGTEPGVLSGTLPDGRTLRVGDVICFELAYDATVHEAVRGSQVLVVQSNNATYRGTAQIPQQFAITRVRAMEARREIVVSTTNAESGFIDPFGRILDRSEVGTATSNSYVVPLRTALTPAVRLASVYDAVTLAGAVVALTLAGRTALVRRRTDRALAVPPPDGPEWGIDSQRAEASDDLRKK